MIRTQVYLHDNQSQEIALLAKRTKKKKAKIIRALIQKGLEEEKDKETIGNVFKKLMDLGRELHLKGPKDLSNNHDKYLYEDYKL